MEFSYVKESGLIAAGLCNLLIAFYVFIKRPANIVNRSFFVFIVGIVSWIWSIALIFMTHDFFYNKFIFISAAVLFSGFFIFAKVFPAAESPHWKFYFMLIPAFFVLVAAPLDIFITGMQVGPGGELIPENGRLFPVFILIGLMYFLFGSFYLLRNYSVSEGIYRVQSKYFLTGIIIFISFTAVFDGIFPLMGIFQLNTLGPISSIAFVGLTAYAIVKHGLLGIKVIIQRSIIYTFLLILIVGFYIGMINSLYFVFQDYFESVFLGGLVTVVLGIFGTPYIKKWFRKKTDKIFFKDKYDYFGSLQVLTEALNKRIRQDEILRASPKLLCEIMKLSDAKIVLDEELGEVTSKVEILKNGLMLKAPIIAGEKKIGSLLMGEKLSGDPYDEKDIKLLRTFSQQAGIALEKARLYDEVEQYSKKLEEKVLERTLELYDLQEEQKQMMIDVSHDLQNLLMVIKNQLSSLEFGNGNKSNAKVLETLGKSVDKASKFLYDLLNLSKLESMREIEMEDVDLGSFLREQVEYFEVLGKERGIEVRSEIDGGITVFGNKNKLGELVMNLVNNAFKYMGDGAEKKIFIRLKNGNGEATLSVSDTGIGMGKDDLQKIFKRFYRISDSNGGGSGLGLAIVKKIVERHGGKIVVESAPGKGSAFSVTLPKKK